MSTGQSVQPYTACLSKLMRDGCLERLRQQPGAATTAARYPVYAAVSRNLPQRRVRLEQKLAALGGSDVTLVLCADKQDVGRLDGAERQCVHPEYVATRRWFHRGGLSNGTLSLALKHQIIYAEVARRGLEAALVVEDDAVLPAELWRRCVASLPHSEPFGCHPACG